MTLLKDLEDPEDQTGGHPPGRTGAFWAIFCSPSECSGDSRHGRGDGRPEPGIRGRAEGDRARPPWGSGKAGAE